MNSQKGFTLVELLAVIVILALIMGIAIVSIGGILNSARESTYKETAVSIINGVRQQLVLANELEEGRYYFESRILEKGIDTPYGSQIECITGASGDPLTANVARAGATQNSIAVKQIGDMGIYKAETTPNSRCNEDLVSYITVTKSSDDVFSYSICLTSGQGQKIISGTEAQLLDENDTEIVKEAEVLVDNPSAPTIAGNATKVVRYQDTTLTCSTTTSYAYGATIYYQFGYATSAANWNAGTITWLGSPSTTNTMVVGKNEYKGTRYYGCKVYATTAGDQTDEIKSGGAKMVLSRVTLSFDATSNGGTLSGTSKLYLEYGITNMYTSATNNTGGTIPTATKSGATFNGWYTAKSGGTQIINASGNVTATTVSGWINSDRTWRITTTSKTLYAQFS